MTKVEALIKNMQKVGASAKAMAEILFESAISHRTASELCCEYEARLVAISPQLSEWLFANPKFPGYVAR